MLFSSNFRYPRRETLTAFSAFNVTTPGVSAAGGGPRGSPGTVRPIVGSYVGSTAAVSYALILTSYWADSNSGSQTYQSPRDVAFVSTSTSWSIDDFYNMGLNYTQVTTSAATRSITVTFNIDNAFTCGYYTVTRSGSATLPQWSSGAYTQRGSYNDAGAGRGSNRVVSYTIPAPTTDQLIVPAWTDDTGTDNLRWAIT